jgi:hypothetical protein
MGKMNEAPVQLPMSGIAARNAMQNSKELHYSM